MEICCLVIKQYLYRIIKKRWIRKLLKEQIRCFAICSPFLDLLFCSFAAFLFTVLYQLRIQVKWLTNSAAFRWRNLRIWQQINTWIFTCSETIEGILVESNKLSNTGKQIEGYQWTSWGIPLNKLRITSEQVERYQSTNWGLPVNKLRDTSKQSQEYQPSHVLHVKGQNQELYKYEET